MFKIKSGTGGVLQIIYVMSFKILSAIRISRLENAVCHAHGQRNSHAFFLLLVRTNQSPTQL